VYPHARETEYVQISRLATLGTVYVDAGANIGFTVLAALRNQKRGVRHAVAFEPDPATFRHLQRHLMSHCGRRDSIDLRMAAVGSANGFGVLAGHDDRAHLSVDKRGRRVQITTLDSAGIPAGEIGLLKLDLEGGEYDALVGARELLNRCKCVQFEVSCTPGSPVLRHDSMILALLRNAGFEVVQVQHSRLVPVTPVLLATRTHHNLLAMKCRLDCERALGFVYGD